MEEKDLVKSVEIVSMATPKSFFARIPKVDLDLKLEEFYNSRSPSLEKVQVKGFRSGKVPKDMLIKKVGGRDAFYEPLLVDVMKGMALENGVEICSWSHLFLNEDAEGYVLSSIIYEFPSVSLPEDLDFISEVEMGSVDEEEVKRGVEAEVKRVREVYTSYQDITTPAQLGDRVTVLCSAFCGKKSVKKYVGEFKAVLDEQLPEWWATFVKDQCQGFETTITFIETEVGHKYFDKEIVARIKLKKVQKVLVPEVDKKILEAVGFKTEEGWRKSLTDRYIESLESNIKQKALKQCLDGLANKSEIAPIPLSWIQMQVDNQVASLREKLSEKKACEVYGVQDMGQLRQLLQMQIIIHIKDDLILRTIAAKDGISIEEDGWQEKVCDELLELTSNESK